MAKPFYSMEEACAKLGKSEDDIRALVRDGELREFRDAGKVFFKAEDVDRLGAGADAGADAGEQPDEVTLESVDEELPTLADTGGGTSIIGLEPAQEQPPEEKEDTVISASGIGVFDDDELEIDADPMAKTQITDTPTDDQVQLDGAGSGSGLLDLTREADDTSLGAELLDEIYPGEEEAEDRTEQAEPAEEVEEEEAEPAEPVAEEEDIEAGEAIVPISTAAVGDPVEGIMGGLLVGALLLIALAGSVAAAGLQNYVPTYADWLTKHFLIYFLPGAVGVVGVSVLIGWLMGRATGGARR